MNTSYKYRIRNPFRPEESIVQEVLVSTTLQYDYSAVPWVAIDTEFLNLDMSYDKLCLIQFASPDPESSEKLRVELVWVWPHVINPDTEESKTCRNAVKDLLVREDLQVLMHVSTADLPRIEKFSQATFVGKLFDTKVAGKILLTNTNDHSMAGLITQLVDPRFIKEKSITASMWDTPPVQWDERQVQYAMNDVIYLHSLKLALHKIADRRQLSALLDETMSIMPSICHLIAAGYSESVLNY